MKGWNGSGLDANKHFTRKGKWSRSKTILEGVKFKWTCDTMGTTKTKSNAVSLAVAGLASAATLISLI